MITYGPIQFRRALDLAEWQFERALSLGAIPPAGPRRRWDESAVADAKARRVALLDEIGTIPDCGAYRAAEHLSERYKIDVPHHVIIELHRVGLLPQVGEFKGNPMYCGRTLQDFDDAAALEAAMLDGQLLSTDKARAMLKIRTVDFRALINLGLLAPARYTSSSFRPGRGVMNVPLYRISDLEGLLRRPDIDWSAVRAVPAGCRSLLPKMLASAKV